MPPELHPVSSSLSPGKGGTHTEPHRHIGEVSTNFSTFKGYKHGSSAVRHRVGVSTYRRVFEVQISFPASVRTRLLPVAASPNSRKEGL